LLLDHVKLLLGLPHLLVEQLHLSLSFSLVEVILTLGEELLLRDLEEVLVREAEGPFHLCDLFAQLVILILDSGEIIQASEPRLRF
jgi:hypothetical protein